jgi:hypothetical protein
MEELSVPLSQLGHAEGLEAQFPCRDAGEILPLSGVVAVSEQRSHDVHLRAPPLQP